MANTPQNPHDTSRENALSRRVGTCSASSISASSIIPSGGSIKPSPPVPCRRRRGPRRPDTATWAGPGWIRTGRGSCIQHIHGVPCGSWGALRVVGEVSVLGRGWGFGVCSLRPLPAVDVGTITPLLSRYVAGPTIEADVLPADIAMDGAARWCPHPTTPAKRERAPRRGPENGTQNGRTRALRVMGKPPSLR